MKHLRFAALAIAIAVTGFANGQQNAGNDKDGMSFDQAMRAWSFMEGEWTVRDPEGNILSFQCTKDDDASCYLLRVGGFVGLATYDGVSKAMMIVGSHPHGTHSIGCWKRKSPTVIEGDFSVVTADGTTAEHTGKFEIVNKDEYLYSIDGGEPYRHRRK